MKPEQIEVVADYLLGQGVPLDDVRVVRAVLGQQGLTAHVGAYVTARLSGLLGAQSTGSDKGLGLYLEARCVPPTPGVLRLFGVLTAHEQCNVRDEPLGLLASVPRRCIWRAEHVGPCSFGDP